ncbi:hypothetical protein V8C34DRAFT_251428 [Trichoderma compactum]
MPSTTQSCPETVRPAETVCCQGKVRRRQGPAMARQGEATEWPQNPDVSGSEQASLMSCGAAEADSRDKGSMAHLRQEAGRVAQPDGTVSCLRCSNRPSEMHQVTSSSYVAAAGWRPLRLPRPLSFDVQKVIRHCCKIQPPRVGQMHLHHGPLGLFHDPLDILPGCFTDGLGLGRLGARHPPWGGGSPVR